MKQRHAGEESIKSSPRMDKMMSIRKPKPAAKATA